MLISERSALAGFSDQIRTGDFAKLYSFFPSICLGWFSCSWKQTSWVTLSVLFRIRYSLCRLWFRAIMSRQQLSCQLASYTPYFSGNQRKKMKKTTTK